MPFDGSEFRIVDPPAVEPYVPSGIGATGQVRDALVRLGALLRLLAPAPSETVMPAEVAAARLLRAARALIAEEERWVQGRYETLRGRRCAMGALQAAARALRDPGGFELARDLLRTEALMRGYSHVEKMNDCSTHAQVLTAFDRAITRATAGGQV